MSTLNSDADDAVRLGIAKLLLRQPFYGSVLLQLNMRQEPIGTFATDGRNLFYDPEFALGLKAKELTGVLMHEATHVAALHPLRKQHRHPFVWNIACDTEVNEVVVNHNKMSLPPNSIQGKPGVAENHYDEIFKNAKKVSCTCGDSSEDDEGSSKDGDSSGAGSQPCPAHSGSWCEVREPNIGKGETRDSVEAEIKQKVQTAIAVAQAAGKLPSGMDRIIDEYLTPKMPWDELLRRFVETVREPFIDWSTPNRRYLHRGVVLPGVGTRRSLADVALAIDTSGSIQGATLQRSCSEVRSVIDDVYNGSTLPVIWFDSKAYVDYISADDEMVPKGGGGTDFAVVSEAIAEHDIQCSGLVVITDGYCDSFKDPEIPVLWVVFGSYSSQFTPPFGEVIELPDD